MSLEKINNNSMVIKYQNTDNVLEDVLLNQQEIMLISL